ncbi:MAG: hypothetical protein ACRD2S_03955 [Terriglobales bacterium]
MLWILPHGRGIKRSYEQKAFPADEKRGKLRLIASPDGKNGSVTIHQDARLYATLLSPGETVTHEIEPKSARMAANCERINIIEWKAAEARRRRSCERREETDFGGDGKLKSITVRPGMRHQQRCAGMGSAGVCALGTK